MKARNEFPRQVREVVDLWITLSDGCRLSGRMWLPVDAEVHPVPAILELVPYRVGDSVLPLMSSQPYLAGFGYAAVAIDARGTGGSDGVLEDEYSEQELADGAEVVSWLARQPWCTGAVGMWGISWMGCNALQIAALRPPALKAVISVCSMVDPCEEDVYFQGGCLLQGNLEWATTLHALMAQPPRPAHVGKRWRAIWLERLEKMTCFIETKLSHQRRDGYWRRVSICEDYDAIACPIYMVGGWADWYVGAIPRFLAGHSGHRKGLIGPWGHHLPHTGSPGPANW